MIRFSRLVLASVLTFPLIAASTAFSPALSRVEVIESDHEPFLRMGPFSPEMLEDSEQIDINASGVISLRRGPESYSPTGFAQFRAIVLDEPATSFQFGVAASEDRGIDHLLMVRVRTNDRTDFSNWVRVAKEGEVQTLEPIQEIQVKVILKSLNGRHTPWLRGLSIGYGTDRNVSEPEAGETVNLPRPNLITRSAWGARIAHGSYDSHQVVKLIVHHTFEPRASSYSGSSTIKGIQNFHMDSRGWSDIGYHYLVGPDGMLFEGRPENAIGAHCPPNTGKLGICVIGNFDSGEERLTPAALETLHQLLAHLAGKYGISVSGIYGHRDFRSTGCPGDVLYARLPSIREEVSRRLAGLR